MTPRGELGAPRQISERVISAMLLAGLSELGSGPLIRSVADEGASSPSRPGIHDIYSRGAWVKV
jgi:hypothetical protein